MKVKYLSITVICLFFSVCFTASSAENSEPFFCVKESNDILPKKISCLGEDYYRSDDVIGLAAALLIRERCSNLKDVELKDCEGLVLEQVRVIFKEIIDK